ncbi:hypothetical protein, partial [Paenibacillus macerans]|uniref:hypothetical protein n=1 Tax=Paenibacillus macerans TaxID=44252 RepID=UPI003D30F147
EPPTEEPPTEEPPTEEPPTEEPPTEEPPTEEPPAEEPPAEEQPITEPTLEQPIEKYLFDEKMVTDNSLNGIQLRLHQQPRYINYQGEFDVLPLLIAVDHLGNPVVGRTVKVILSRGEGQLVGNTIVLTNDTGYAIFSDLKLASSGGDIELTFILDDEKVQESIQVIYLREEESSEEVVE